MAIKGFRPLKSNSNDISGNSYNGTDTSVTYDNTGHAIFNGSSSKVSLSNSAGYSGNAARTIMAEVKVTFENNNTGKTFWGNGANSSGRDFSCAVYDNYGSYNNFWGHFVRRYQNDQTASNKGSEYYNGIWRFVAVSYDGVSTGTQTIDGGIRFYDDFNQTGRTYSEIPPTNQTFNTSQSNVMIGGPGPGFNYFKGGIRNVMTFTNNLSNVAIKNYAMFRKGFF